MDDNKVTSTLALLVNNRSGVLMRVVGLFSRRGYNISSLSVGETENPEISRITVVVKCDRDVVDQIKRQVGKLVDVLKIYEMKPGNSIQRELVLVKVKADSDTRTGIIELAEIFKAKIVDVMPRTISMVVSGNEDKIDSFLMMVKPYGVIEMARTGITAIERGSRALSEIEFERY